MGKQHSLFLLILLVGYSSSFTPNLWREIPKDSEEIDSEKSEYGSDIYFEDSEEIDSENSEYGSDIYFDDSLPALQALRGEYDFDNEGGSIQYSRQSLAEFVCTSEGVFADVENCTNYYRCNPALDTYHYNCPIGSYFEKLTLKCVLGTCKLDATTPATSESTSEASTTEVSETTPEEPVTTPEVPTSTSEASTTEESVTTPEVPVTTPEVPTSPSPACFKESIYADPANCTKYFRCSATLVLYHYDCPIGSYFDGLYLKCLLGLCPSSTTTPKPTPVTTTTKKPTPANTTTKKPTPTTITTQKPTPATTTAKPTTPKPFQCSTTGIFADAVNCHAYYRCSGPNATPFHYLCPIGAKFNAITLKCVAGDCPAKK